MKSLTITTLIVSAVFAGSFAHSATGDATISAPDKPASQGTTINPVLNLKHERRISPKVIHAGKKPRMIKQEAVHIQGDGSQGNPAGASQTKHAKHIRPKDLNTQRKLVPQIAPAPKHGLAAPKETPKSTK